MNSVKKSGQGLIIIFVLIAASCQSGKDTTNTAEVELPPVGEDFFLEITQPAGIDFTHSIGDEHLSNLVETVGGGTAFLDFDQDGFLDLYICNGAYVEGLSTGEKPSESLTNKLFRNKGNGKFEDITASAGVGDMGYGMGVAVGDFDNNGYPDIFLSNHGPNVLYQNNGDGTFSDITKKAGMGGDECSVGATWLDFDKDGLLDIYVGNYIKFDPQYNLHYAPDGFAGPMSYDGESDRLYKNLGSGKFTDVSQEMGVFNPQGRAMGVGSADYDNDGYVDIFVANDHMLNYLYHNEEGKEFRDLGIPSGVAFNQMGEATISMAVDFADIDGDGWIDLFVSDDGYCSLYKNMGNGLFAESSYAAGIASASGQFVGWAASFIDYDNDTDYDIFKVNGEFNHLFGQEDQLFENVGDGKFENVSLERGKYFRQETVGRGACFGDYDNDGDIDVYITNLDDRGALLRNDRGNLKNWLLVELVGTTSNRDGMGSSVKVTAGDLTLTAQKKSSTGYLSQNDPRLHFGLGDIEIIDKIEVTWPSGRRQVIENIEAGQIITITEPEAI